MLDNYRDLLDELLETPNILRERVAAGDGDDRPPDLLPLMVALRDRDQLVLQRLQSLMRETDPYLPAISDDVQAKPGTDPAAVLAEFETARGEVVSLLMNLSLKDWDRTGTHEIDGEITLADEVERHVEFDEEHVARIRAL
jgi:hypothetical protein